MKIIKEGKVPDHQPKKKTCFNCKCQFEYEKTDIQYDREGAYVECPSCKKLIFVQ